MILKKESLKLVLTEITRISGSLLMNSKNGKGKVYLRREWLFFLARYIPNIPK
jgi:hypothetical protein